MNFPEDKQIDVACVGNALMDILVEVEDSVLIEHDLVKGGMFLVEADKSQAQLAAIADHKVRTMPGGASANTARGVSALGGQSVFFGSIGTSMYGKMYRDGLESAKVKTHLHESDLLTGNAITYITPDHERTFSVHLGAASDLQISSIDPEVIHNSKVVYLEAFQFEAGTKPVLDKVIEIAKKGDTLVSLDLNDAGLIERNLDLFKQVVHDHVDILFANETEGAAFAGVEEPLEIIEKMKGVAKMVVLKCGPDGAHIMYKDEIHTIAAAPTSVVDTTGAGDLFAAGFLYGITNGYGFDEAGSIGAKAAAKIISKVGVDTSLVEDIF